MILLYIFLFMFQAMHVNLDPETTAVKEENTTEEDPLSDPNPVIKQDNLSNSEAVIDQDRLEVEGVTVKKRIEEEVMIDDY